YLGLCLAPVERVSGRDRNGDHDPGAARELLTRDARRGQRVLDAMLEAQPARAHVERGQLVGAVAHHGHTERLEALEREREIEDQLRARADDAYRMARDRLEVRGFVEGTFAAPMHAADPTGGH